MPDRTVLRRSVNTEHALTAPRPRLRGVSHLAAAVVAVPAAVIATVVVSGTRERLGVFAFGVGVAAMLSLSALLHLKRWTARAYERLFRLDHTGIYLTIGGTGVAIGLLGLDGWPGSILVVGALAGTLIGIVLEWLPFAPPRGLNNAVYLTYGWVPVALLPWLWATSGGIAVGLLLAGGVLYTVGAVVVAVRRPDPWPRWFGYHEVFHLLVIGAVVLHAVLIGRLVT